MPNLREKFSDAIFDGNLKKIKKILSRGMDIEEKDHDMGFTPLMEAVRYGNPEVVGLLLEHGADPNARKQAEDEDDDEAGATPLILLPGTLQGDLPAVANQLVAGGADINARDDFGNTALMNAVTTQMINIDLVKTLIELGADANLKDQSGVSPLTRINEEISRLKDSSNFFTGIRKETLEPLVEILAGAGGVEKGKKEIQLLLAAEKGDLGQVKQLLQQGVDINYLDNEDTALGRAAAAGQPEVIQYLISAGADINLRKEGQLTPLMLAAHQEHFQVCKALVQAGADINLKTRDGETALDYARYVNHKQIIDYLRSLESQEKHLENNFGIMSIDLNEEAILVKTGIESVTPVFQRITSAKTIIQNVFGQPVQTTPECYFIIQFKGHPWTLLYYAYYNYLSPEGGMSNQLAKRLSEELNTGAIYYCSSDTSGAIGYWHYNKGEELEFLDYSIEYNNWDKEDDDSEIEDDEDSLEVFSKNRELKPEDIHDPHQFVDNYFKEQKVLIPGWGSFCMKAGGEINPFAAIPGEDVKRIDFVVVR